MAPSLPARAYLPSLTACNREMKVWSACLHTSVSSRVTGTHLFQLLACWGQGKGGSGNIADPPHSVLGPAGEWYLEAELRGLGAFGHWWQLQEVPTDDELDPSKWLVLLADSSRREQVVL